ncbi:Emopamil-binding protein [Galdieria sulphuraria]|nr:Emopamil-binding protein [Galdieria sulphuraria]
MSQTKKTYSKKLSSAETAVLAWFLIDAATHLFCELPFVIHSLTTTVNRATHWSAILWKEYAKADPRWGRFHDCTVALEVPTSILWGPLSLACAYGVYYKKPWRFYWQTILSLGELYGNWMTFGPEWLNQYMLGTTELDPQGNWVHKWIYLFFANIVWVIIPILLLVESTRTITAACAKAQAQHLESYHLGFWSAFLIVLTLSSFFVIFVMFAILLPLGLLPTIVL